MHGKSCEEGPGEKVAGQEGGEEGTGQEGAGQERPGKKGAGKEDSEEGSGEEVRSERNVIELAGRPFLPGTLCPGGIAPGHFFYRSQHWCRTDRVLLLLLACQGIELPLYSGELFAQPLEIVLRDRGPSG